MLTTSTFGPLPANALTNNVVVLDGTLAVGGFTYASGSVDVGAVDLTNPNATSLITIDPQSILSPETVGNFTALGADAFFIDANAHGVARLYRTDGTALGTTLLTTGPNFSSLVAENNAVDGQRVFLTQTTSTNHGELLAIGTADPAPTVLYDFGAGTTVASITNAANTLFIVTDDAGTRTLWSDDGSNVAPTAVMAFSSARLRRLRWPATVPRASFSRWARNCGSPRPVPRRNSAASRRSAARSSPMAAPSISWPMTARITCSCGPPTAPPAERRCSPSSIRAVMPIPRTSLI
jgi:hypothetical protein